MFRCLTGEIDLNQPFYGSPGVQRSILQLFERHPIVDRLRGETDGSRFSDWSQILFDQATLAEGGQLEDPATFVKRLNELMLALAGGPVSKIWTPG